MQVLLVILGLVWGILNIILFFKIWKMCDHVKQINSRSDHEDIYAIVSFLMHIGEKEKAKEVLLERIIGNRTIFSKDAYIPKFSTALKLYEKELKLLGLGEETKDIKENSQDKENNV